MTTSPQVAVKVRKAKPRDAEAINSFDVHFEHLATLGGTNGPFYTQYVASKIASQSTSREIVLVAESKGQLVGYAWSKPVLDAGPVVDVDLLAVTPSLRRQGVSQQLIASSVEAFRQFGYMIAVASVTEESLKAFVKAGWESVPEGHEARWDWPGATETYFGPDILSSHYCRVVYRRLTSDAPAITLHPATSMMGMPAR